MESPCLGPWNQTAGSLCVAVGASTLAQALHTKMLAMVSAKAAPGVAPRHGLLGSWLKPF